MTTMQHGKRHEIEFFEPPSHSDFLDGIAEVLCGPGATWTGKQGIAFRCLSISPNKCTYIIEEVDIWRTLQRPSVEYKNTKLVQVVLTCNICKQKYDVWRRVGDDWWQDKYWLYTDHCPACPPMTPDVWLAQLEYYPARPSAISVEDRCIATGKLRPRRTATPEPKLTIDLADFE